jgi:hypothetical protein
LPRRASLASGRVVQCVGESRYFDDADERDRQRRPSLGWPSAQQSRGEFAPAISTTRTSQAALSECEDTTKVQFNSRAGPQSFQPGASSRDPRGLQTETLGRAGRVARPRGLATDWPSACHAITMTKPPLRRASAGSKSIAQIMTELTPCQPAVGRRTYRVGLRGVSLAIGTQFLISASRARSSAAIA